MSGGNPLENLQQPEGERVSPHAMFQGLGEQDDASMIGQAPKRHMPIMRLVIMLVLAVGGGSIYWMRQTGMRSGMDFEGQPVSFESQYTPEDHARFERVLRDLELAESLVQIPSSRAGSNPFFIGIEKEDTEARGAEARAELERERQEAEALRNSEARRNEIADALGRLRLGTIMTGRKPMATIGGEIVLVGDRVGEVFTVVEILPQSVTLEVDSQRFTITPESHGPGSRR